MDKAQRASMTDDKEIWVSQAHWREGWAVIEELPGGGQGTAFRVRRKCDGHEGFLKAIKAKRNWERRARFSREANSYATVTARGIPRLIETNAHRWEESGVEPYLVTDFIEGPTLRQWRGSRERVELQEAMGVTRELLGILSACHEAGLVHRDVKPDNIILADADLGRPVLLDFGLSFRKESELGFDTEDSQELGNRFLRLPELAAGSPLKQDVRSDLSFAAGILYYLVTGRHPDILQDAEGRLPHQREEPLELLRGVAGARLPRLLSLFDKAFAPLIADRFTSAGAVIESMKSVIEPSSRSRSEVSRLQNIRKAMDTESSRRREVTHRRLTEAHEHIFRVFNDVEKYVRESIGISLNTVRHGFKGVTDTKRTLSWTRPGSEETVLAVTFDVREAGDEIVINLSGDPVYRTPLAAPRYEGGFEEEIREELIARLHEAVMHRE